jgi:hypothetical protein
MKRKLPIGTNVKPTKTADTSIQQLFVANMEIAFLGHPVWLGTHSYVVTFLERISAQIAKEVRVCAYCKIPGAVS